MDHRLIGKRIFLIEDDLMLGESLTEILQAQGAEVDWHKNAERAICTLEAAEYDLLILDIGLPKISGFEILKQLRHLNYNVPVLILSARDLLQDRVQGLDLGADDYVLKPFDLPELLARIRMLIRRRSGRSRPKITVHTVTLDPDSHQVFYLDRAINLSRQEYRLLQLLMENAGHVLTRDRLESTLLDKHELESNALEVHIHHLRKKLFPQFIRTIRGVGYLIQTDHSS